MMKAIATILAVTSLAIVLAGCSGAPATQQGMEPTATETTPTNPAETVVTDENGTHVTMEVTKDGFVPAEFTVPAGKPVTLSVTRRVAATCATALVMKDYDIDQALPLDQTVEIRFTPEGSGQHRFACPMDMIAGTMTVENQIKTQ